MSQNETMTDTIALVFAGAHLIEVERMPRTEVNAVLNDRRARQVLIGKLNASSTWRNEGAPWLRRVYDDFAKIGHKGRNRTLQRVLPEFAEYEAMNVEHNKDGDITRTIKTKMDPLVGTGLQDQFFLLCQAIHRSIAEKKDVRKVLLAMHD